LDFYLTSERGYINAFLDSKGIDLYWSFRFGNNGETGWTCVQEKTGKSDIKEHFKRYPCMPVYLLRIGDSEEQIEYVYLTLLLLTRSYNLAGKEDIEARRRHLAGRKSVNQNERRVWLDWRDLLFAWLKNR
jgi:hypothetical protein